jgi:hypothetical protein
MSGNIRRWWRFSNIVARDPAGDGAILINFQYARATDVADVVRRSSSIRRRNARRRTNLIDLMKGMSNALAADRHLAAAAQASRRQQTGTVVGGLSDRPAHTR